MGNNKDMLEITNKRTTGNLLEVTLVSISNTPVKVQ